MERARCITADCDHHDRTKGCTAPLAQGAAFACAYGRFEWRIRSRFGGYGQWAIRSVNAYSDAIVARLMGKSGRVEVWGGRNHRDEVWFVPKGTRAADVGVTGRMLYPSEGADFRGAVEQACALAGVQEVLPI